MAFKDTVISKAFPILKKGHAIVLNSSTPVATSVAGNVGEFFDITAGKLAKATNTTVKPVFAVHLPSLAESFKVGESVNVSRDGKFVGAVKDGVEIKQGDLLMIDGNKNNQLVKFDNSSVTTAVAIARAEGDSQNNLVEFRLSV